MKILKLSSENIKRLQAVEIEPSGRIVKLTGKNAAGKSSVIDSIWYACGGKDSLPGSPIRRGEDFAKVQLTLDGDPPITITRTFTGKDSYLKVEQGEGFKASSPQKLVDGLIGRLSFDPLEFTNDSPAKQLETLRELSGIDTRDVEFEVAQLFEARAGANKAVKQHKALTEDAMSRLPSDCPTGVVSLSALADRLDEARGVNAKNASQRSALEELEEDASEIDAELTSMDLKIAELVKERNRQASLLGEAKEAIGKAEQNCESACKNDPLSGVIGVEK